MCLKYIILWGFPTSSKRPQVVTIHFILTTSKYEKNECRHVIVVKEGALENSTYVTNLLLDVFSIAMKNTGGDES